MIPVTKPFLPSREAFQNYLDQIWERNWLTNFGPLNNTLEKKITQYLQSRDLLILNNGTTSLQVAIKALGISGEVITTPFSFIATTSSIVWEGLTPVFVDIDPHTFNIDVLKMEEKITNMTSAILVTHVFGNPADIRSIDNIGRKHGLKVIYDAAQAFGTKYKNQSVFNYGDVSCVSFHATKLFHMTEGGGVFASDDELRTLMRRKANFGYTGVNQHEFVGINGKNSELHAAMGHCVMDQIKEIMVRRQNQYEYYTENLSGANISFQKIEKETDYNHSYFPIVFNSIEDCLRIEEVLNDHDIFPRHYFKPSLNTLPFVNTTSCPISESLVDRILCLPLYHELSIEEIDDICNHIIGNI